MVFFNEETEAICEESGRDIIHPTHELRNYLDSKITTTRLGDEAGASSVPNIMTTVDGWDDLLAQTQENGLGTDWVLQTAYGDSGKTTYFVTDQDSWTRSRPT